MPYPALPLLPRLPRTEAALAKFWARFEAQVDRATTPDGCHPWTGAIRNKQGYGCFGESLPAHRLALLQATGIDTQGDQCTLHTCDNPKCCNPAHLYVGSHAQNMQDKHRWGRQPLGERSPHAKLTQEQVMDIRARYAAGAKQTDLAKAYGVSQPTISCAVRGVCYGIGEVLHHPPRRRQRPTGAASPHAKLTQEQVRECRARYAAGESQVSLAKAYGIGKPGMSDLLRGKSYPEENDTSVR